MKIYILILLIFASIVNADSIRDDSKSVVLDTSTNLMWQDDSEAKTITKNWSDAINYCEDKNLGGYNDWKLPNINELYSLADRTKSNPAISTAFQNIVISFYWSVTTKVSDTSYAWVVYFDTGYDSEGLKVLASYVRCVRLADN